MNPTLLRLLPIALLLLTAATAVPDTDDFPVLLGSSSTPLHGSTPERTENIRLASLAIDGTILQPGERFSYNETVGQRERERGFLPAPAIVHDALKPVIGGGICQVSSTLFHATLLSDLQILERHRHSFPVNYIALGMDATISWGSKDLRFRNSLNQPILITAEVSDDLLTFRIHGKRPLPEELRLDTEYRHSPSPYTHQEAEPGMEILLYRLRIQEGRILEREWIHTDYYPSRTILRTEPESR